MKRVKSSRWWQVFLVVAFLLFPLIGAIFATGTASALSGSYKVDTVITFPDATSIKQTDTITIGSQTYTASQQGCLLGKNKSEKCTYQTSSISWKASSAPSVKACSSILNDQCSTFTANSGKAQVFTITGSFSSPGNPGSGTSTDANNQSNSPECLDSKDPLSWIICGVFQGIANACDWIFTSIVTPFLITSPIQTTGGANNPTYQVWSNFRIYGDIFLLIALLVMVFGEAIGGGLIDAYTVKKALPRLLVAVILVNLSIYIVAFMVDITNILGKSLGAILIAPFKEAGNWHFTPSAGQSLLPDVFIVGIVGFLYVKRKALLGTMQNLFFGKAGQTGGFGKAALEMAIFTALPIILALLAVFVTLIIRKGLILFLVLVSPVAFALYCLPNTEQYFKKWWSLLLEALMVYPIVIVIFAMADILSITILDANGVTPNDVQGYLSHPLHPHFVAILPHVATMVHAGAPTISAQTVSTLASQPAVMAPYALFADAAGSKTLAIVVAFLLQFLPLLAIPFAFRMAGGTLSKFHEFGANANKRFKEGSWYGGKKEKAQRSWADQKETSEGAYWTRRKENWDKNPTGVRARLDRRFLGGRVGKNIGVQAARAGQRSSMRAAEMSKEAAMATEANNDGSLLAAMYGDNSQDAIRKMTAEYMRRDPNLTKEEAVTKATAGAQSWEATGLGWGRGAKVAAFRAAIQDGTVFSNQEELQEALYAVAGNDQSLRDREVGFAYAYNKQAGRNDLSPDYGTMKKLADKRADYGRDAMTREDYVGSGVKAALGTSNTDLMRMKGKGMNNLTEILSEGLEIHQRTINSTTATAAQKAYAEEQKGLIAAKIANMEDSGMYGPEVHSMTIHKNVSRPKEVTLEQARQLSSQHAANEAARKAGQPEPNTEPGVTTTGRAYEDARQRYRGYDPNLPGGPSDQS